MNNKCLCDHTLFMRSILVTCTAGDFVLLEKVFFCRRLSGVVLTRHLLWGGFREFRDHTCLFALQVFSPAETLSPDPVFESEPKQPQREEIIIPKDQIDYMRPRVSSGGSARPAGQCFISQITSPTM